MYLGLPSLPLSRKKIVVDWPSSDPSHVEFGCGKRLVRFPRTVPPFPLPKMALSEDTKVSSMGGLTVQERIVRLVDITKTIVHYGWVPFVIYVGFMSSQPRPNLLKYVPYRLTRQNSQPSVVVRRVCRLSREVACTGSRSDDVLRRRLMATWRP